MAFMMGLMTGLLVSLVLGVMMATVLTRRLRRMERRARHAERLAELGTLTGGLAHEIKNPLSTVQLNLQLLQEDLRPDDSANPRILNRLNIVQRETARLKDILDDFLRYAGKLELDRKPTDLNHVLEELVDFFTPQAQLQRVQLRLKPFNAPVVVPVDAKLIKQAILNLMLNGLQAIGDSGGDLILAASRTPEEAVLEVIDTGRGIADDAVHKIFDAYYSTRKGGTGLGLAMTRRIVEEHGGQITVKSDAGKGSVFAIHLPLS